MPIVPCSVLSDCNFFCCVEATFLVVTEAIWDLESLVVKNKDGGLVERDHAGDN